MKERIVVLSAVVAGMLTCPALTESEDGIKDLIAAPFKVVGITVGITFETVGAVVSNIVSGVVGENESTDDELAVAISRQDEACLRETVLRYKQPLDRVFKVNDAGEKWTPLGYAAVWNNALAIELLVDKGANPNFICEGCIRPIYVASNKGCVNAVRILLKKGAYPGNGPLRAARNGHVEIVKAFVEEGNVSVNSYWDSNDVANSGFMLATAAGNGNLEVCKYLVKNGAKVDFSPKPKDGKRFYSAIEMASKYGHLDVVMYFYEVAGSKLLYAAQKVADKKNSKLITYLDRKVEEYETARKALTGKDNSNKRVHTNKGKKEQGKGNKPGFWQQVLEQSIIDFSSNPEVYKAVWDLL